MIEENFITVLAEDDDAAANLIEINLKRAGINSIRRAKNGKEALDILTSLKNEGGSKVYHILLFLDIRMPVMDGIQVLKKIKSDEVLKMIPVVMLTTTENPSEVEECYRYGCNFYIKKPVEYKVFVETIKNLANFAKVCILPSIGGKK